jgi:hypothetical protein
MKRSGYLYESAFSRERLYEAYLMAARNKRGKRACFGFERRLGANLEALYTELQDGSYRPRPYYSFTVHEPKPRVIHAPAFRDLVVQHAVQAAVGPIFGHSFIDQSFACRVGYGTHKAADYAQRALQAAPRASYTLKLDIRKFFYRIDREILRQLIERKVKDRRFVELMMLFADHGEPAGIPIGNLLSQLYALIYLNPLDHFVKRELRVALYCRYVDDFVLFGLSRERALECQARIVRFLAEALKLELSRATIAPLARGLNFVGYRTWATKRFVRRRSLYNFRAAVRRGRLDSLVSTLGHARRTHSLQHLLTTLRERNDGLYRALPKICRRAHHAHAQAAAGA